MQLIYIFFFSRFLIMFNPYAESLSSTGEPPTESSPDADAVITTSAQNISSCNETHQETLFLSSSSSRSLSVQEPDSGYEASPSSIAEGISNQRFFGEQSASGPSENRQVNSDDEFDIIGFHFSESESELDEYDTFQDCSSSPVSCSCLRTDSSTTNATATSNCDNSRCNSSELSFNRPASQPIQIPNMPSSRLSSNVSSRIGSPVDVCPLTRSYPMDFSPRLRLGLIPERGLPLSWPTIVSPLRNCRSVALPVSRSNPSNRDIPQQNNNNRHNFSRHPVRSRRQIIDSDASSYNSSDNEGPEDVFSKFLFISYI